jgi:DNA-binding response OmpR family regulator
LLTAFELLSLRSVLPPALVLSALVVDPNHVWRVETESLLAAAGFAVIGSPSYKDALPLLMTASPTLLVTEVRLGAYNGLQLAIRGRAERPDMALVVASAFHDAVLQREAEQFGATFVHKPVTPHELLAAIRRTLARRPSESGAVAPIRAPFERRRAERRQMVATVARDRRQMERRRGVATGVLREAVSN